ncbi:MAG: hypothetical protein DRP24_05825 [Thermotoga sp.]|nr:MAG: hypothetical protein DRP24_05825 [Thermotoga sp.]
MATTTQKILGESVKVEVGGLDIVVDGDIEVTLEREVVEHKERGKAVVEHIMSKRVKISGSLSGIPNSAFSDVIQSWLGADSINTDTQWSDIEEPPDVEITFKDAEDNTWYTLKQVKITSVKPTAPMDDVAKIEMEFVANEIQIGG